MRRSLARWITSTVVSCALIFCAGALFADGPIQDEMQEGLAEAGERAQGELAATEGPAGEPSADEPPPAAPASEEAGEEALEVRPEIVEQALASYSFSLQQIVKKAGKNLARVKKEIALREEAGGAQEGTSAVEKVPEKPAARPAVRVPRTEPARRKCEVEPKRRCCPACGR